MGVYNIIHSSYYKARPGLTSARAPRYVGDTVSEHANLLWQRHATETLFIHGSLTTTGEVSTHIRLRHVWVITPTSRSLNLPHYKYPLPSSQHYHTERMISAHYIKKHFKNTYFVCLCIDFHSALSVTGFYKISVIWCPLNAQILHSLLQTQYVTIDEHIDNGNEHIRVPSLSTWLRFFSCRT